MSVFDWFKTKATKEAADVTIQTVRRPLYRDWTDDYTVNKELTRGLYHNTFPGTKLGGSLAYVPIATPVNFMGLPIPVCDTKDENLLSEIDELTKFYAPKIPGINTFCHTDGTIWAWPYWSSKNNKLNCEIIDDDAMNWIVRDLETREIIKLVSDEEILLTVDLNKQVTIKRRRTFTTKEIIIEYFGTEVSIPQNLRSVRLKNVFNVIPIPFSNNPDPGQIRGHSEYERIVTDIKDYHDIDLALSKLLAKWQPKLVQYGGSNANEWLENIEKLNGWTSASEIDISAVDLLFNRYEQEKTEMLWPERAHEGYIAAKVQKFRKIVEASGVPEIFWGLKTEGNNASVEESRDNAIKFVQRKQDDKNEPYKILYEKSLEIIRFMKMESPAPPIEITWNDLDNVSDEVRSIIFKNITEGVSKLMSSAAVSKEWMHKYLLEMYPSFTEQEVDDYIKGIAGMAKHKQFVNSSYADVSDFDGDEAFDLPDGTE